MLAVGLALVWWLHASPAASAGGVVVHDCLERDDAGLLCADTDLNECTVARCDSEGTCNQNAELLIDQPCQGYDDNNECTSAACVPCGPDGSGSACCYAGAILHIGEPCQDTDGNVCTIAGCRGLFGGSAVECDQRFDVPEGEPCPDTDNNVCTSGFCREFIDLGGVCVSSPPISCNDNNACTFDLGCHPEFGCQSVPILCFDGDDNECTTAACDPSSGCETVWRIGEPCQDTDGSPCTVALCGDPCTGGDCGASVACDQRAECTDSTSPDIVCPPDLRVFCAGAALSGASGMATATDDCDLDVVIEHEDAETEVNDPPISVLVIDRTWTATNDCELSSQCVQTIEVREPQVYLDIKPGSCPNLIDTRSRGTIRMSILGTPDFDVSAVDVDSLVLLRADDNGSFITPDSVVLQDTGTPFDGELCGCHRLGGDGIEDLTLKFNNLSVVSALHLNTVPPGATIRLVVYGVLSDGCEFTVADCVLRSPR